MKSCNKIREAYGLKILVNEETYNKYKGTYEEQIEELQDKIQKAIVEIERFYNPYSTKQEIIYVNNLFLGKILDILKGGNNE